MSFCCGDCEYMHLQKTNDYGECYCGKKNAIIRLVIQPAGALKRENQILVVAAI